MKSSTVSLLSFNLGFYRIRWGTRVISQVIPFIEERIQAIPEYLLQHDADIISLQEVYSKEHRAYLTQRLWALYPYSSYIQDDGFVSEGNGLMFFSKLPIISSVFTSFSTQAPVEKYLVKKWFLRIECRLDSWKAIQLYNLHACVGYLSLDPESIGAQDVRNLQLLELSNACKLDGFPIVIGDFNSGPSFAKHNYESFCQQWWLDISTNSPDDISRDPTNPLNSFTLMPHLPPQKVDHIFVRNNSPMSNIQNDILFQEQVVETKKWPVPLSDHYAVSVWFTIH